MSHAILGGSTCLRWANCPGSVALLHLVPPDLSTKAAEEGTAAHYIVETRLNHWKQYERDFDDIWPSYAPNGVSLYDEMFESTDIMVDYVVDICCLNWSNTWMERRVSLSDDMYGTLDVGSYSPMYRHLDAVSYTHQTLPTTPYV